MCACTIHNRPNCAEAHRPVLAARRKIKACDRCGVGRHGRSVDPAGGVDVDTISTSDTPRGGRPTNTPKRPAGPSVFGGPLAVCGSLIVVPSAKRPAELVAIDIYQRADEAGLPVTLAMVEQRLDELLGHSPACACRLCPAAAKVGVGHVYRIAAAWQGCIAATRRRGMR